LTLLPPGASARRPRAWRNPHGPRIIPSMNRARPTSPSGSSRRVLLAALAGLLCLAMTGAHPARAEGTAGLPPPDDTGSFVGTWYYVDPGFKIAIFISEDSPGVYKIRYHVRDKKNIDYE